MSKMFGVMRNVKSRYRTNGDVSFGQWRAMLSCGHMVMCHDDVDEYLSARVLCPMCKPGDGNSPAVLEREPELV